MSNLVRDDALNPRGNSEAATNSIAITGWSAELVGPLIEQCVGENNRAGVFHAAKACGADNQREFLVRIGRNRLAEEGYRRSRRRKSFWCIVTIFLRYVVNQGHRLVLSVDNRALIDSHNHAVRRYRFRLFVLPMRGSSISSERDEFSICRHLVSLRRGDGE